MRFSTLLDQLTAKLVQRGLFWVSQNFPATAMSTLVALAPDCIAQLLEYLPCRDIHALWSTGDCILRRKVVDNVRRLRAHPRHNEKFPFSALRLPHLDSLSVIGSFYTNLRFEEDDIAAFNRSQSCNSLLLSLRLKFCNAAAFFCLPGSTMSRDERFPSLTKLSLQCKANDELAKLMARLPKTLTNFSLSEFDLVETSMRKWDIFEFSKLPKTLLSLKLECGSISEPGKEAGKNYESFADLLPPQLTSLTLSHLSGRTILSYLPKSLETLSLRIHLRPPEADYKFPTSLLPPNLTDLTLNVPFDFDCPFPSGLRILEVPTETRTTIQTRDDNNPNWKGLPLPTRLELVSSDTFGDLKRFLAIKVTNASELEEIGEAQKNVVFPIELKAFSQSIRFPKPLLQSIKRMIVGDSIHGKDLRMLPRNLAFLTLQAVRGNSWPPWTIEQVRQLPQYLRTLSIQFNVVDDGRKLAHISGIPLKTFRIRQVPLEQIATASYWLPSCLPPHLKHLRVSQTESRELSVSPDSIRFCKLGEVVPHLESFGMGIVFNKDAPMGPVLASLPSNLLDLDFIVTGFEPGALAMAPRSLNWLLITFKTTRHANEEVVITPEHLQGLPERLEILRLNELPHNKKLNLADITPYLPKTIWDVTC